MNIRQNPNTKELNVLFNTNLKTYNSFGIEATVEHLVIVRSENDVYRVLLEKPADCRVLGGGSNVLITQDLAFCLLKNEIKGIEIIDEDSEQILVQVGAGESWHDFVMWAVGNNYGGIENLALIPGSVGAAPIQNIGAYGVEQDSVFHSLKAIHIETGVNTAFYKSECRFGYRDSIFKQERKGQYVITQVRYILKKNHSPVCSYKDVATYLADHGIENPGIKDVADAVIAIRKHKLPDPLDLGNAGSFFKNPVVSYSTFEKLRTAYENIPNYPVSESKIKLPAAWLIDQCGLKGIRMGDAGTHERQALVIVNHGKATGSEILHLARYIQATVREKFGIDLEPEVNIWP
jgi:UDP-N-acetylmuramate dehydrogenase